MVAYKRAAYQNYILYLLLQLHYGIHAITFTIFLYYKLILGLAKEK